MEGYYNGDERSARARTIRNKNRTWKLECSRKELFKRSKRFVLMRVCVCVSEIQKKRFSKASSSRRLCFIFHCGGFLKGQELLYVIFTAQEVILQTKRFLVAKINAKMCFVYNEIFLY